MPIKRLAALWLLACSIAACTVIPTHQTVPAGSALQANIQPASYQSVDQTTRPQQPEKITFPPMVKTTELGELEAGKDQQLNEALKQLLEQEDAPSDYRVSSLLPQVEIVRFMTKTRNPKRQVKIAGTGGFRLILEAGTQRQLEILDADTTDDGVARLRLPAGSFETLLHLQGPWQPSSSLELEDSLYYVKDTLSSKKGKLFDLNRWHLLGTRPLPVPQDWYSPDGQTFVLQFNAQDVKEFQLAWWRTDDPVPFPPGINRIGPEGGLVELPGVGTFKLLPNALEQPTTIVMRQVMSVLTPRYPMVSWQDGSTKPLDFISPAVKIEPVSQVLKGYAEVNLTTDLARLGNNSAGILEYLYTQDPDVEFWRILTTQSPDRREDYDNYPTNLPGLARTLGYFVRVIDKDVKPTDGGYTLPPDEGDFQINSAYDNVLLTHGFRVNPCKVSNPDGKLPKPVAQKAQTYCNNIFGYYTQLMDKAGAKKYPRTLFAIPKGEDKGYLKVEIKGDKPLTKLSWWDRGSSEVLIPSSASSEFPHMDSNLGETITHELWHVFQNADFVDGGYFYQISDVYGGDKHWIYEGPAEYMGASTMNRFPFAGGNNYYAYHYVKAASAGITALGKTPLYELKKATDDLDYRSSAFFTYLSNPTTYAKGDEMIVKLANYFSDHQPKGGHDDINSLKSVINTAFASSSTKTLSDHFFKFAHFAISKERLAVFPKDKAMLESKPIPMQLFNLLPFRGGLPNIVGHNQFQTFTKTETLKSLSAKYYAFNINPNNRSGKKFALKVKLNSSTPNKFRVSALFYGKYNTGPHGHQFRDRYATEPDARLGGSPEGMKVFNAPKGFVLTTDFNDKYESVYLVVAGVDPDDRDERSFNIEVAFQALGDVTTRSVRLVEPDGPPQVAGGGVPDIYDVDQRPKMVMKVPGCDPNRCEMLFEHRQEPIQIAVKVPTEYIKDLGEDEFGVPIQEVAGTIPNDAKPGGRVTVVSDGIPVDTVTTSPIACWMLDANADYRTSSQKLCPNQVP